MRTRCLRTLAAAAVIAAALTGCEPVSQSPTPLSVQGASSTVEQLADTDLPVALTEDLELHWEVPGQELRVFQLSQGECTPALTAADFDQSKGLLVFEMSGMTGCAPEPHVRGWSVVFAEPVGTDIPVTIDGYPNEGERWRTTIEQ